MRRSILAVISMLVLGSVIAPPAAAQSDESDRRSTTLAIEVKQHLNNDSIDLSGLPVDTSTDESTPGTSTRAKVAEAVAQGFGLTSADYALSSAYVFDSFDSDVGQFEDLTSTDASMDLSRRLFVRTGDDIDFKLDTSRLASLVRPFGYGELEVGICPVQVSTTFDFSRQPDRSDGNCDYWSHDLTTGRSTGVTISYLESPDAGALTRFMTSFLIVALIVTAVIGGIAAALRIKLNRLGAANISLAAGLSVVGWITAVAATLSILGFSDGLDEWALAGSHGYANQTAVAMVLGVVAAIPFIVGAFIFVSAKAPVFAAPDAGTQAPGGPGVPSWMADTSQSTRRSWAAQPSWQQPRGQEPQSWAPARPPSVNESDLPSDGDEPPQPPRPTWQPPT